jgi:hypothetical protein
MKTGTFLDMDMASLGQAARGWTHWWLDELSAMIPARWQQRRQPLSGLLVVAEADGQLSADGGPLDAFAGRPRPATILFPEERVLIRSLTLPAVRRADLAKLVTLDLDRLMPFPPGTAYASVSSAGAVAHDGKLVTRVAALPKADIAAAHAAAEALGLSPRAMGVVDAAGDGLEFDFLPAFAEEAGLSQGSGAGRWWLLVALLFAANIGLMIWKDARSVSDLAGLVDAQKPIANAARALGARLSGEDRLRSELIETRRRNNGLAALALASQTVPAGAWVQRYSWNGETLRLSGYKQVGVDVLGAMRKSGAFATVRATTTDVATDGTNGQPFDVSADWRGR